MHYLHHSLPPGFGRWGQFVWPGSVSGSYRCIVKSKAGEVSSDAVSVQLDWPPVVTYPLRKKELLIQVGVR
jgi:hypothetical protein